MANLGRMLRQLRAERSRAQKELERLNEAVAMAVFEKLSRAQFRTRGARKIGEQPEGFRSDPEKDVESPESSLGKTATRRRGFKADLAATGPVPSCLRFSPSKRERPAARIADWPQEINRSDRITREFTPASSGEARVGGARDRAKSRLPVCGRPTACYRLPLHRTPNPSMRAQKPRVGGGKGKLAHPEVVNDEQRHGGQRLQTFLAGAVQRGVGDLRVLTDERG
jgi:hypothetical protein